MPLDTTLEEHNFVKPISPLDTLLETLNMSRVAMVSQSCCEWSQTRALCGVISVYFCLRISFIDDKLRQTMKIGPMAGMADWFSPSLPLYSSESRRMLPGMVSRTLHSAPRPDKGSPEFSGF